MFHESFSANFKEPRRYTQCVYVHVCKEMFNIVPIEIRECAFLLLLLLPSVIVIVAVIVVHIELGADLGAY